MNRQELIDVIGVDAAMDLTRRAGGSRIFVSAPDGENPVAKVIGADKYKRLHCEYGGEMIELPSHQALLAVVRANLARRCLRGGMSVRMTAMRVNLSRRTVARLRDELNQKTNPKP